MKRKADNEESTDSRRPRVELEHGIKRDLDEDSEVPEAVRQRVEAVEEYPDELHDEYRIDDWCEYDDITGEVLDPSLVKRGKDEEMRRFREMGVYTYASKDEAYSDPDGGIVDTRWVTVNNGTRDDPNVRCRLVAREFAEKGNRDDLFAGTPPLVSVRVLLSLLAMKRAVSTDFGAMFVDVKCASLYDRTKRSIYIWLPPEDPEYSAGSLGTR